MQSSVNSAKCGNETPPPEDVIPRCVKVRVRFVVPKGQMPPGPVTLHVCVDADGNLTSAPLLVNSSGYPTIDQIALTSAKQGEYKTAMHGKALPGCFNYEAFAPPHNQSPPH